MTEICEAICRDDAVFLRCLPASTLLTPLDPSVNILVPYYSMFAEDTPTERMLGTFSRGILPIFLAVADSKIECVKYLVDLGGVSSETLILATGQCVGSQTDLSHEVLDILLENTTDASFRSIYQCLWIAIRGRASVVLRKILSHTPKQHVEPYMKRSLTGIALSYNFSEIINVLIGYGLFDWGVEADGVLISYMRDREIGPNFRTFELLAGHHLHEFSRKPFSRRMITAALALCRRAVPFPSSDVTSNGALGDPFSILQLCVALSGFYPEKDTFSAPVRFVGGDLQRALSKRTHFEHLLARTILVYGVELGRIISDPKVQEFLRAHFSGMTLFERLWARYELSLIRESFYK